MFTKTKHPLSNFCNCWIPCIRTLQNLIFRRNKIIFFFLKCISFGQIPYQNSPQSHNLKPIFWVPQCDWTPGIGHEKKSQGVFLITFPLHIFSCLLFLFDHTSVPASISSSFSPMPAVPRQLYAQPTRSFSYLRCRMPVSFWLPWNRNVLRNKPLTISPHLHL